MIRADYNLAMKTIVIPPISKDELVEVDYIRYPYLDCIDIS